MIELDEWQKQVLETKGNLVIRAGRQVGKSTIISICAAEFAANNPKKSILVISATERQAYLLFSKILYFLDDKYPRLIRRGKDRPTKSEIKMNNGSIIRCLPTGMDGLGIRGYTTDWIIADEAHFIPEPVWDAVLPQLITRNSRQILISTTHGREGYFYRCFQDNNFIKFHVTSEEVALKRAEPQRSLMLEHLEREKKRMTKVQYAQEYLGEFVDELKQFFSDELVKRCMTARRREIGKGRTYYLGVDVARMGDDESTFEIVERYDNNLRHVDNIVTTKTMLNETLKMIIDLDKLYSFKEIYIDDGGIGVGVFDYLLDNEQTKRKVIAINNNKRLLNKDGTKKKKLLKEDLYNNLLMLMEQGRIALLPDDEIFQSFKSVQYEYTTRENSPTYLIIYGTYTHIVEGIIRAAWCVRDRKRDIWVGRKELNSSWAYK